MTIYEDVSNATSFTWSQRDDIITYENESQKNQLQIIDNQVDTLMVALGGVDTLRFIRLYENPINANNKVIEDASVFDFLFNQTVEINIPNLDWQIRKVDILEGGNFVKYDTKDVEEVLQKEGDFELGTWELLVIRNQYFLFLNNLKSEKPLLIHLENLNDFKLSGQLAYANNLHQIDLQVIVNQIDISKSINELIIGKWQKPTYIFNSDSTFIEIADADTLNGNWKINATNELLLLTKNHKTLQFGFINTEKKSIEMQYLSDFHNEFSALTILKK
jgi:hypothetical protein